VDKSPVFILDSKVNEHFEKTKTLLQWLKEKL